MSPIWVKFFKHAGFVVAGAATAAVAGMVFADGSPVLAFITAHPVLSGLVPFVSGLLGSASKWLQNQADAS